MLATNEKPKNWVNSLTQAERDAIILEAWKTVPNTVFSLLRKGGIELERDEIVGQCGLCIVQAATIFDPERGVRFSTFAASYSMRIILSGLHKEIAERSHSREGLDSLASPTAEPGDFQPGNMDDYDRELLSRLSETDRFIVKSLVFDLLEPARIAEQLNLPLRVVLMRMRNATAKLRKCQKDLENPSLFEEMDDEPG